MRFPAHGFSRVLVVRSVSPPASSSFQASYRSHLRPANDLPVRAESPVSEERTAQAAALVRRAYVRTSNAPRSSKAPQGAR